MEGLKKWDKYVDCRGRVFCEDRVGSAATIATAEAILVPPVQSWVLPQPVLDSIP